MIEVLIAVVVAFGAYLFGRRKGKQQQKVKGYDDTRARISDVRRSAGDDVADRLREHAKR